MDLFLGLGGSEYPEGEFRGVAIHALNGSALRSANDNII